MTAKLWSRLDTCPRCNPEARRPRPSPGSVCGPQLLSQQSRIRALPQARVEMQVPGPQLRPPGSESQGPHPTPFTPWSLMDPRRREGAEPGGPFRHVVATQRPLS